MRRFENAVIGGCGQEAAKDGKLAKSERVKRRAQAPVIFSLHLGDYCVARAKKRKVMDRRSECFDKGHLVALVRTYSNAVFREPDVIHEYVH